MNRVTMTVRVAGDATSGALAALTARGIRARVDGSGEPAAVVAEAELLEGGMTESARRELAAKVGAALGDEGIPFEEAGYGESASQGDHVKFSVAGVDSDGRTVEFFARDWDEFDRQFEAAFGRQRGPGDRVEAQRLDDGAP